MDRSTVHLGCLILFLIRTRGYIEALEVIQSPRELAVPTGHSAFMSCCWKENSRFSRLRVTWTKNPINQKNENKIIIDTRIVGLISQTETRDSNDSNYNFKISDNCYNLTILVVTSKDISLYTCKITVEIPHLENFTGQGTYIRIQDDDKIKASTSGIGVAVPLAAFVTVLCFTAAFCLWMRQTSCFGRHHGMVIREAHQRSMEEINEIDEAAEHNSNSSRGSEQWCPVQLYESIDYFIVQDNANT